MPGRRRVSPPTLPIFSVCCLISQSSHRYAHHIVTGIFYLSGSWAKTVEIHHQLECSSWHVIYQVNSALPDSQHIRFIQSLPVLLASHRAQIPTPPPFLHPHMCIAMLVAGFIWMSFHGRIFRSIFFGTSFQI